MTKQPSISVAMPVYNGAIFLRECLDSILCQTFQDFELLIVDDGSTDDTCNIVESYKDERIRLVKNRHDYIASCNLLLKLAKGKYIARMDADDIMMPKRLQIQYEYMETHPEISVTSGYFAEVDLHNDYHESKLIEYTYTLEKLLRVNHVVNPASMLRTDDIIKNKILYEKEYIYAEDYRFWANCLKNGLVIKNCHII